MFPVRKGVCFVRKMFCDMKKIILFFLLCLGTALLINGILLLVRHSSNVPNIVITPNVVDFGKLPPNSNLTHKIQVKNTGTKILHLLSVKTSCHCTKMSMEKTLLHPGESGTLFLSLDTDVLSHAQKAGSYEMLLISDDPIKPILPIIIKYAPSDTVWIEPNVLDFGRVDKSNLPVMLKFRITQDAISSFSEEVKIICDDDYIQLIPLEGNKANEEKIFSLVLKDNTPSGELHSNVSIFFDSDKKNSKEMNYQNSILGYVRGNFFAKPKYIRAPLIIVFIFCIFIFS
jgi:hypothetical protein